MAQLLFTISLAFCHFISMASSINQEGIALLSFKKSLENHSDSVLTDWNSSDSDPCSWKGVSCNNELRVVSLSLPNKRLSGSLHPSIGTLLSLRRVNLRNNLFHGTLPVELFEAERLKSLVLSGNSFSGFVPNEIGRLKSLQSLDFSENSLKGSIPLPLMQCKRLKTLVLSRNSFSGDLGYGVGSSLVNLQTLNLSFNGLTGLIPEDIGNLMNLRGVLDLSHNFFSGEIPKSLVNLPEIVYIDLSYNNLSGPIPKIEVLLNAGPNAFEGNPRLCGLPLKISCAERNIPVIPSELNSRKVHHHSRVRIIIAATIGTAAGISLLSLLLACYLRKGRQRNGTRPCCLEEKLKVKEFICFKSKDFESEASLQEGMNQKHVFVGMDPEIDFNLDQLLKASAFLLGKNGIGIVYKVVLETGLTLAVRRLEDHSSQRLKDFLAEVEAMGKIKHPNLVNLRACCWSPEEKLLIYDYIPNGDLASAIHGRSGSFPSKQLSWPVRLTIMRGIARGLAYIHRSSPKRYVHGHLCSANILLGENLEPKISGFGLGRVQSDQSSPYDSSDSPIISRKCHYQAPEASKITKPSQKWDVYSFGLVVLEMVTGKSPVLKTDGSETDSVMWVRLAVERSKPIRYVLDPVLVRYSGMEESVVEVIEIGMACVNKSPDRRPSMRNVLESLENLA
ncbi:PREDICTED: probable inactive leucine-rich repeat receptor-like protein kinase At1g66830 [Tarenaya hassleriana]|uniref:probable inactive leucine-rich repeat receptor-like protein kinase At1g66830 n=1 Tax=Tarenaya hassleriana TaxID=28532 RepID=UPI0008FD7E4E|nr:PREDICTED: probable inactive leucine-rich repeat receptor-like protein kinase At1g66830 [Tarenaya hassleriana]